MKNKKVKKLASEYFEQWTLCLGLRYGTLKLFFEEFIKDASDYDVCGICETDWRYQDSSITLALHKLREMDEEQIEMVVIHELMHIFLNEMREDGIDHEERVATNLQKAFVWVRDGAKCKK
jgi:predicted SprT family Zn-dependent metalloprotease